MAEPRNRCLYEILGVSRDCTQDEIRSAYRRLALQLHPDKVAAASPSISPAAATAAFQELLHAYEVLSDPKERSWYDSHRSQILFSDPSKSKSHSSSFFDLDLFSFFSTSAFSGFSDSGKGFFKVYGDLFSKIYSQELYFVKELGLPPNSVAPAPLIGNLDSPYTQVTAFYNYWLGFVTVMDFGWVDEYDSSAGVNRRSRRAMEEENKKLRKKARREYNDTVRGLAAFAKKRDKRVRDMQVKRGLEEEKRRAEEKERKKEEERRRMERVRMYEEPEWAKVEEEEEDLVLGFEDERGKKKGNEEFYCVVCNKKFKSDKQWKNHEQSKKHREKVADLRDSFQEEAGEGSEDGGEDGVRVSFDYERPEEEGSDVVDELCDDLRDDVGLREVQAENEDLEESEQKLGSDDEASILEAMVSGRKNKKSEFLDLHDSPPKEVSHSENDEQIPRQCDIRKSHRNRTSRGAACKENDDEDVKEETCRTRVDESEVENNKKGTEEFNKDASSSVKEVTSRKKGDQVVRKNEKGKKQQMDGKGPEKKEAVPSKNSKGKKQKATAKAPGNACETCGENFDSRNKLFSHLGDTGHAMLKSR